MPDTYSVKAVLSADAKNFVSAFAQSESAIEKLQSHVDSIKGGLKMGILQGVGQQLTSMAAGGLRSIVQGLEESSAAWKTFQGNMENLGKSSGEIANIKSELQDFATASIYSASDMASTYSQLAAVGTKNCTELVKGFGGLAAAASNPAQAMKTLSQQATQMAAKPTVQWMDFKLMLEQTPAGIAAVAKEMGKAGQIGGETTADLIKAVQAGTVETQDFFDAITKVAGSGTKFNEMATQYKTVGQAMDGLGETITGVLQPSFDALSENAIASLTKINDAIGNIDGEKLAANVKSMSDSFQPFADAAMEMFGNIGHMAWDAMGDVVQALQDAFGNDEAMHNFEAMCDGIQNAFQSVANFISDHSEAIAGAIKFMADSLAGIITFMAQNFANLVNALSPYVAVLEETFGPVAQQFKEAFAAIGEAITEITGNMASASGSMTAFKAICQGLATALSGLAGFLKEHATLIAKLMTNLPLIIGVLIGVKIAATALQGPLSSLGGKLGSSGTQASTAAGSLKMMAQSVMLVASAISMLATAAIALSNAGVGAVILFAAMSAGLIALMVIGVQALQKLAAMGTGAAQAGEALRSLGLCVLMIAAAFAVMAASATALASAGGGAIAVFTMM